MKLRVKHTLNKISVVLIFLSLFLFVTHMVYTIDLKRRQKAHHVEAAKYFLTLVDERVSALSDINPSVYEDIFRSLAGFFSTEPDTEILVFNSGSGEIQFPAGVVEKFVSSEILEITAASFEGEVDIEDRYGYFVRLDPPGITVLIHTTKSELFFHRNQLIFLVITLLLFFSLVLFLMDRRMRHRLATVLKKMKICFDNAFISKGQLLKPIEPLGEDEIDSVVHSYNAMVGKAGSVFKRMENRINALFQQRDQLKKIISLYKKYSPSETVIKISEKNVADLTSRRQNVSSLSIELCNYLGPVDELYPQVITNELNSFHAYIKNEVAESGGIINFTNGYLLNIVYGTPQPDESSFSHALDGARKFQQWVEERNSSDKNISGVRWELKMGLSYGTAVIGTVGDNFVALSAAVEESVRALEWAKFYGVFLVTDALDQLRRLKDVKFRTLDRVQILDDESTQKNIYEVFLKKQPQQDDAVKLYHHALDMFFDAKYDMAVFEFKKVNTIFGNDPPSRLFLKRCEKHIKS
jgi:class 3 adenylate cyclase